MEIVYKLLSQTVRCFYDPKSVVIFDLLIKNNILSDEELATALKDKTKEVNRVCYKLKADGIIKVESRWEALENDFKKRLKTSKSYYFIDFPHAINAIKYKIYKIGKIIEKKVQDQMNNLPFVCSPCNREFNALDMLTLETNADKIPICDYCGGELFLDQKNQASKENSERFMKFMSECKPIVDLLKLTDSIILPEIKFENLLKNKTQIQSLEGEKAQDLKFSKESGASVSVHVEITSSGGEKVEKSNNAYLDNYYSKLAVNANTSGSDGLMPAPTLPRNETEGEEPESSETAEENQGDDEEDNEDEEEFIAA